MFVHVPYRMDNQIRIANMNYVFDIDMYSIEVSLHIGS